MQSHRMMRLMQAAAMIGIALPNFNYPGPRIPRVIYPRSDEHAAELVRKLRAFGQQRQWRKRAKRRKIDLPASQRFIYRKKERA